MTTDRLIAEMDEALKFPGVANSWTMPIKARTEMLATGIRTPVGIKLFGNDLEQLDALATEIEEVVREVPGTPRAFAERLTGAYYQIGRAHSNSSTYSTTRMPASAC